jgi:processive 1,2-diacylglycerol beta-glucosyltransferase
MTEPRSADPDARSVLLLASSYGGGHRMVADTVAAALRECRPGWTIEVVDFFERFVGLRLSRLVARSYRFSARRAPYLYGGFYHAANWVGRHNRLQAWLNRIGRRRLLDFLRTRAPDLVVSTYPTPAAVVSSLHLAGEIDIPTATILTDFAPHNQWIHPGTDLYLVATSRLQDDLVSLGVPCERIAASGIPIRAGFAPRSACPVEGPVLITVGAEGMLRRAFRLCQAVAQTAPRTIIVCGRDRRLLGRLRPLTESPGSRVELHGYVPDIDRHYARAALLVGKPGGVTAAEALAVGLPMVIYNPIPGQEAQNAEFLVAAGAARVGRGVSGACRAVADLLAHPEELRAMSARAGALGRPEAARDAALALLDLVRVRKGRRS